MKRSRILSLTALALAVMTAFSVMLPSAAVRAADDDSVFGIGDTVYFGYYEQDGDFSNGSEDIEWFVADVDHSKVLLVSRYILDTYPINAEWKKSQWADSDVRAWLNGEFIKDAFGDQGAELIVTTTVDNSKDRHTSAKGEKSTEDKVFLLSRDEVNRIFKSTGRMRCEATEYAIESGLSVPRDKGIYYWWWTRTGGQGQTSNVFVSTKGDFDYNGYQGYLEGGGIRPALWLDLNMVDKAREKESASGRKSEVGRNGGSSVYGVGDIYSYNGFEIALANTDVLSVGKNSKVISARFCAENCGEEIAYVSTYHFTCYADGVLCGQVQGLTSEYLWPGRAVDLTACYEVPKNAGNITIRYCPGIFSNDYTVFHFEENRNFSPVLSTDGVTDSALEAGEKVECTDRAITLLSCEKDESFPASLKPTNGHHYVTCRFEIENVSGFNISVHDFDFRCFADGKCCPETVFRDDRLSENNLTPRSSISGSVSFLVPDDADSVEFEYQNPWDRERAVFSSEN